MDVRSNLNYSHYKDHKHASYFSALFLSQQCHTVHAAGQGKKSAVRLAACVLDLVMFLRGAAC